MKIFVFGSSLSSTLWNGAATYYRGIYKNLSRLGYQVTFAEPAIYGRQEHQDKDAEIDYAEIIVYRSADEIPRLIREAARADVVVKHSGVGSEDDRLEKDVLKCRTLTAKVIFWDVDAPATLARLGADSKDPFHTLIPSYDAVFTYGGGPSIKALYEELGAAACVPIYNGLDPETHHPVAADPSLACDLAFVGHRLPDREARVEEFFFRAAALAPEMSFVLGGEGWGDKQMPSNVRWIGHVPSDRHNVVNCSARMVLNVNRDSMAKVGFSPPTRIFEAAGAGACVVTDHWEGIEQFFIPGAEILTAQSGGDVVAALRSVDSNQAANIGFAMLNRAINKHSYESRAEEVHAALRKLFGKRGEQVPHQAARSRRSISLPI